ncbi:MV entry-fusion complex protein [Brazilian porcupinepox virus 1]|nr:MV entry-fusion complex protein [Brazilian porcupinepox virus 1]
MEKPTNIYFTPVFLEPTLKHSLLNAYKYTFIIIFEIFTVVLLLYIFFRTEIKMLFSKDNFYSIDKLDKYKNAKLLCNGKNLYITGIGKESVSALDINKNPIIYDDCLNLLKSINGSRKVSLDNILRK